MMCSQFSQAIKMRIWGVVLFQDPYKPGKVLKTPQISFGWYRNIVSDFYAAYWKNSPKALLAYVLKMRV